MQLKLSGTLILFVILWGPASSPAIVTNPIADTGQTSCFDNLREISCPSPDGKFWGQDGNYLTNPPSYRNNGDGTITDLVTGLMWSKGVSETKATLAEALETAREMSLAGHRDWRLPNIKELYSLINFEGSTGSFERKGKDGIPTNAIPFINTDYFDFRYGNTTLGERFIDAQWLSSTRYVGTTMNGNKTVFGVNFADGRIKGYPEGAGSSPRGEKKFYVRFVRGSHYGDSQFVDNGNGTITDGATGLMWMQNDSGKGMSWQQALEYAENSEYGGYRDWRLPNAKELQYLVDYSRSPDTTGSAAINPLFNSTSIINEAKQEDYPYYWTSTTHREGRAANGVYICFGRGIGRMHGKIMDVHGAGAQRSDPKTGQAFLGHGPQGDAVRVNNFVRLVRGGRISDGKAAVIPAADRYPGKIRVLVNTRQTDNRNQPGQSPGSNRNNRRGPEAGGDLPSQPSSGEMRDPSIHFIKRLDRDGDNKVSRSEFDGPQKHFSSFDQNGDGYISADEAPTGPPPPRMRN